MHSCFLKAADSDLLPYQYEDSEDQNYSHVSLSIKTKRGVIFPAPIGIASGLCKDGTGVDALLRASGMSKDRISTFIEVGSCTPERQRSKKVFDPVITIDLDKN